MIGLITAVPPRTARTFHPFPAPAIPAPAPRASAPEFHLASPRYELKYRINETTARAIRDYARAFLTLDPYADRTTFSYPISSLYLDTDDLLTFRATVNGTRRNYKLRIRTYDDAPGSPVFFEVKRGWDDQILKERGAVRPAAVQKILTGNLPAPEDMASRDPSHRVAVENFVRLMQQIDARPKAYVRYVREAWMGRDDPEVRFTLDRDVAVSPKTTTTLAANSAANPAKPFGNTVILEIKFFHLMPAWFRDLAATVGLVQAPAAKYCDGLKLHAPGAFSPVQWPSTAAARAARPATRAPFPARPAFGLGAPALSTALAFDSRSS